MWQVKEPFWQSRQPLLWVKSLTWAHPSLLLLPGASLGHMGSVQLQREIISVFIYLCHLKLLWENSSNGLHFCSSRVCACSSQELRWNVSTWELGSKVTQALLLIYTGMQKQSQIPQPANPWELVLLFGYLVWVVSALCFEETIASEELHPKELPLQ